MHHIKYSYLLQDHASERKEEILRYTGYCLDELEYLQKQCINKGFLKEVNPWILKSKKFCNIVLDCFDEAVPKEKIREYITAYLADDLEVCRYEMMMLKKLMI